jgi:dTDP-4-dehydrorhamnose 3,5-epimerase-like enzyme
MGIVEAQRQAPFEIRQVLFQFDLPKDSVRGGHAHLELEELIVCLSGRVKVRTESNVGSRAILLKTPTRAVYVPPLTWVTVHVLERGTRCLVLRSKHYDERDYVRDRTAFRQLIRRGMRSASA